MPVLWTEFAQIRESRGSSKPIPRSAHIWRTSTWVSGCRFVWCIRPCYAICGIWSNAALRPWLTAMIDMRSRKIVGTAWSATPSSHTISSALRVGIESFGIPQILYVDNGKDYEKVGRIDFSPECSGVLVRLGIQPQYCLPRHPQSKL